MTKEEFVQRYQIYQKAKEHVKRRNGQKNITWTEEINMFADMTPEELKRYKGLNYDPNLRQKLQMAVDSGELEDQKTDHVLSQALQPVSWDFLMLPAKDQG